LTLWENCTDLAKNLNTLMLILNAALDTAALRGLLHLPNAPALGSEYITLGDSII